jgi:glutathione S-transferase
MQLLYGTISPYVRKVMIAAIETDLRDQLELITFPPLSPTRPLDAIIKHNPTGKIPTLILDDGTAIFDSRVICEYFDHISSASKLYPLPGPDRWRALTMLNTADGLLEAGITVRFEIGVRPEDKRSEEWIQGHLTKVRNCLDALEREWRSNGDQFAIGEISVVCALGWLDFRMPEQDWRSTCRKLAAWYEATAERPSVVATKPVAPS